MCPQGNLVYRRLVTSNLCVTATGKGALGAPRVEEGELKCHVDEVVRSSVEETLNALLDAEADPIYRAQRYGRPPECVDGAAGRYERKLETKAGQIRNAGRATARKE
jgi:hypothetical protein